MSEKLEIRTGHKADMWFAVSITRYRDSKYLIRKVFYDIQKCLDYIEEANRRKI